MLDKKDYKDAFELITNLAPDFVQAALAAKIAPNTAEKQEYEAKAAYIYAINETMKTLNQMRLNVNPPKQSYSHSSHSSSRYPTLDEDA